MEGWVILHRKFLSWEWFDNDQMVKVFIYLLLKANHKPQKWKGILIKRGQIITGLDSLSKNIGISIQTLRTCLKRLENTEEIKQDVTNKYRIITICKYDDYQEKNNNYNNQPTSSFGDFSKMPIEDLIKINNEINKQLTSYNISITKDTEYSQQATNNQHNNQPTSNQQATNKQPTANNNVNNVNNVTSSLRSDEKIKISSSGDKKNDLNDKKAQKKESTITHKFRLEFEEYYRNEKPEEYYYDTVAANNLTKIITKIKFIIKKRQGEKYVPTEKDLIESWKYILLNLDYPDSWVYENLSIPNINSKFNEIIAKINEDRRHNGRQQNKKGASIEQLANVISNRFNEGYK